MMGMYLKLLAALFAFICMTAIGTPPASAQDCNAVVAIHNKTSTAIHFVYISNVGADKWGPDWMGNDVIMPNATQTFNVRDRSGATRFDVKVVFRGGGAYEMRDFNACAVSHIDANPNLVIAY